MEWEDCGAHRAVYREHRLKSADYEQRNNLLTSDMSAKPSTGAARKRQFDVQFLSFCPLTQGNFSRSHCVSSSFLAIYHALQFLNFVSSLPRFDDHALMTLSTHGAPVWCSSSEENFESGSRLKTKRRLQPRSAIDSFVTPLLSG
jgi:hypothetical protein